MDTSQNEDTEPVTERQSPAFQEVAEELLISLDMEPSGQFFVAAKVRDESKAYFLVGQSQLEGVSGFFAALRQRSAQMQREREMLTLETQRISKELELANKALVEEKKKHKETDYLLLQLFCDPGHPKVRRECSDRWSRMFDPESSDKTDI